MDFVDDEGNLSVEAQEKYVRYRYANGSNRHSGQEQVARSGAVFDEFLRHVRAEVWAKAYFAGYADGRDDVGELPVNPFTGLVVEESYAH